MGFVFKINKNWKGKMKIFNTKNIKIYITIEKLEKENLLMFGIKMYGYGSRQFNWSFYGIEFFISVFKIELNYLNIKKLNNSICKKEIKRGEKYE